MLALLLLIACGPKTSDPATSSARLDWPSQCPDPSDPKVHYKHDTWADREICQRIRFGCDDGQAPIESPNGVECGCGCIDVAG